MIKINIDYWRNLLWCKQRDTVYIIKDFYVLESKVDIQKIYGQLDVVENTDLEYNKYIAEE